MTGGFWVYQIGLHGMSYKGTPSSTLLEHLGNNHLDIGVGTGFYLTHVPESSLISLMDLNEASLNAASTRAGESKIKHKISHDVFDPYPAALHGQFDSISMFYLLHCLLEIYLQKAV